MILLMVRIGRDLSVVAEPVVLLFVLEALESAICEGNTPNTPNVKESTQKPADCETAASNK